MARIFGSNDPNVSSALKVVISAFDENGTETDRVYAYLGEGSSQELQSNWESPFEGDSVEGLFEKGAGLLQVATDVTLKTELNSRQVWKGTPPPSFNLVLILKAYSDAKAEVENAITALKMMASPELKGGVVSYGSKIPSSVRLTISRKFQYTDCKIESVNDQLDAPRTKDGDRVYAMVNVTIQPSQTLNASDIQATLL